MGQIKDIKLPAVPAGVTAQVLSVTAGDQSLLSAEYTPDTLTVPDLTAPVGKVDFSHAYKIGEAVGQPRVTSFDVPAPPPPPVVVPVPESISGTVTADDPAPAAPAAADPAPAVTPSPAAVPSEPSPPPATPAAPPATDTAAPAAPASA